MTELYPTDADLNALSGQADAGQEVLYPAIGQSPYYTSFYRMLHRLLDVARRAGDFRVYKDGDPTCGVRAGRFMNGSTAMTFAGAAGNALADNSTNYLYLTADGTLVVNQSGLPDPATTPHVPLATIAVSNGTYGHDDITDLRGRAMYRVLSGLAPAVEKNVKDLVISADVSAGAEAADARLITVQLRNAAGAALAGRARVRVWLATADFGAPSATGNTVTVTTGTALATRTANADYELITTAGGVAAITVTITGAATRYIMAEIDGLIYSSGAITWAA